MKVLMVTPYLPCPESSGGQTRSFNLLKHLSSECEVTLFSFLLPDQKKTDQKKLKKYCQKIVLFNRGKTWQPRKIVFTGFSPYPFLVANYFSWTMKEAIKEELAKNDYDLVHVECFYLMPNIPKTSVPVFLVDQTIEFAVYQHFVETLSSKLTWIKPLLWIDVLKLKFWEARFWKQTDYLVAVSDQDKKLMEKISQRKVTVVPNGVSDSLLKSRSLKKYSQPTVLFGVANFKWMQNKEGAVNLLKNIWPEIHQKMPSAKLLIAGRHSEDFISSLELSDKEMKNVEVAEVNKPEEAYSKSWVLVAPMKSGGGSRTKFFEAMACRLPIVTTPEGIEGIEAQNNQEVIVGPIKNLAKLSVKLMKDKNKMEKIGQKAHQLVSQKYSWEKSAQTLLKVYQSAY